MSLIKSSQPDLYALGIFPSAGFQVTTTGLDKVINQDLTAKPMVLTGPVNLTDIQTHINSIPTKQPVKTEPVQTETGAPAEGPQPAPNQEQMPTPTLLEIKPEDIFVSTSPNPGAQGPAIVANEPAQTQTTAKRSPWPFLLLIVALLVVIYFMFFRK